MTERKRGNLGHKVNPYGFRLGTLYSWTSKWFAQGSDYQRFLLEDVKLREFLFAKLRLAGLVKVEIERSINTIKIILWVARPGVVIGRGGSGLDALKKIINEKIKTKISGKEKMKVDLEVKEVKNPDISAQIICQRLIDQLIKRYPYRRAVGMAMDRAMNAGAKGVKVILAGRIGGSEIGRREKFSRGTIPLQTLRADIDYCEIPALTKSGYVGIKVLVYKKEEEIK